MEGRSGSEGENRRRTWLLLAIAAAVLLAVFAYCRTRSRPSTRGAEAVPGDTLPIPAPPRTFGDTASVADYLAYGRSLTFASDSPSSAVTRHVTGTAVSILKMSPETRLSTSADSIFVTGRIIARIQTDSGVSPYGTPPGVSYMWVRRVGDGYRAQIITDEPTLPGLGRILSVPAFYHVPLPPPDSLTIFCVNLDPLAPGTCCRCYSGCWNPWPMPIPFPTVESLVRVKFPG